MRHDPERPGCPIGSPRFAMPSLQLIIRKPRKPESRWLGGRGETAAAAGAMVVQPGAMAAGVTAAGATAVGAIAHGAISGEIFRQLFRCGRAHLAGSRLGPVMWVEMSRSRRLIERSDRCHCRANM